MYSARYDTHGQNGHHERIDFLTSQEKKPSKQKRGILIGVLVGLFLLAGLAALLVWLFVFKGAASEATLSKLRRPSTKVFSGHMKLADVEYSQILENTESTDFKDLAGTLQETVSIDMSPFFCFSSSVIFLVCRGRL
ncbi:unnamed protein product [Tetraodon nigroviridis]|uniref:(spotted green pufferfish) hypothetical protein n=1 Tax=Tetraodon nigroviridis TaxID=99883 RepID=Q4RHS9_TETNG|nr:unnamed protein product [Tetraodon nigroviridis]